MEDNQGRTSVIGRFFAKFSGNGDEEIIEDNARDYSYERREEPTMSLKDRGTHRYEVTIRKSLVSFEEAVEAADGLRRGEQQVFNVLHCQPDLREKILNFMYGAAHMADAEIHELGEHVWLCAPACAYVETAAPTKRRPEPSFN
jgi:cell division inhibitor SepF